VDKVIYLAEVKGVREHSGAIRLTEREFVQAQEYQSEYALIVVSNLNDIPKMTALFNPLAELKLEKRSSSSIQAHYHSASIRW
jgi:uncharacterized protein (UPF0332 family)